MLPHAADQQFITRPDEIIRRDRNILHRRVGGGHFPEKILAETIQLASGRHLHEALKIADILLGQRNLSGERRHIGFGFFLPRETAQSLSLLSRTP